MLGSFGVASFVVHEILWLDGVWLVGRDGERIRGKGVQEEEVLWVLHGVQVSSAGQKQVNLGSGTVDAGAFLVRKREEVQTRSPCERRPVNMCLHLPLIEQPF